MLYRQFAVTIVVSVLISTVVALTLSPAMCAILLRPSHGNKNFIFRKINSWLESGNKKYVRFIERAIRHRRRVLAGFGMILVFIFILNRVVPVSFIPAEDQGYFKVELELPEGDLGEDPFGYGPGCQVVARTSGSGLCTERNRNQSAGGNKSGAGRINGYSETVGKAQKSGLGVAKVMDDTRKELNSYPESKVYLSDPPVIPGLGTSGGFELQVEARGGATFENLVSAVDTLMKYAGESKKITGLSSSLQAEIPQLYFDVDRDKAKFLGIPMSDIFSTMKAYTGSVYVNDFNMFNRVYKVYIQAEAPYRAQKENIGMFFVRTSGGDMVPLTAIGNAEYTTGPGNIKRFNMFTTAVIRGMQHRGIVPGGYA